MILFWRGWGILAVVIPIAFLLLANFGFDALYGEGYYTKNSSWTAPLAVILSTPLIYFIGRKLNNKPARILIDPKTNEEVVLKETNDLFWIPMQYWSFIIFAFTVFIYSTEKGWI